MASLVDRVQTTVRKYELFPSNARVLTAVSGGADSVALVHLLQEIAQRGACEVRAIAHFNHQLRAEADRDEAFCRELAGRLNLPFEWESDDVRALAEQAGASIEDAARSARYAFLERAASRIGADVIAVGHTRDDQAETFLLRLLRGAGTRGLSAIYPRAGQVVRPLIEIGHDELIAYLDERGIAFREDESNRDVSIPRNRVRHELIPYLREHLSPGVTDVLAREAVIAREDADWLEAEAMRAAVGVLESNAETTEISIEGLLALPPALARRIVRQALQTRAGARFVGFEHADAVLQLIAGGARDQTGRTTVDLPGQRATLAGARLIFSAGVGRTRAPEAVNPFFRTLSIPGEVVLPEVGWVISAEQQAAGQKPAQEALAARGPVVAVAADAAGVSLGVRGRKPGDALRPLGLGGRKKLQDLFVDRKVPREDRDRVPLVVDARDRIVWVVGQTVAEDFRVTDAARGVILLKARRLGGNG